MLMKLWAAQTEHSPKLERPKIAANTSLWDNLIMSVVMFKKAIYTTSFEFPRHSGPLGLRVLYDIMKRKFKQVWSIIPLVQKCVSTK